jgi:hypothetical protein
MRDSTGDLQEGCTTQFLQQPLAFPDGFYLTVNSGFLSPTIKWFKRYR